MASKFLDLTGLQSVVDKIKDKFAPKSHASTSTTYGTGTGSAYGHCKTVNNLTNATYYAGNALSAYQGYVLNQNKADKSEIPTAISQLTNDSGFTTTPINHASTATTYGVGTTTNYGHVKTINNRETTSYADGNALSAYQGYLLQMEKQQKVTYSTTDITAGSTQLSTGEIYVVYE